MNRISFLVCIILTCLTFYVQGQELNSDIIEVKQNDSLKFFLYNGFSSAHKACATAYCIAKMDTTILQFEGEVKGFYLNDRPFFTATFVNGKSQGKFMLLYPDGSLKCQGNYKDGIRDSLWTYYYRGNNVQKVVYFKDGQEYLKEFYNIKGQQLVKDFEGTFNDDVPNSIAFGTPFKYEGLVKKGRFDGEWKIHLAGRHIGTEYFSEGLFQKGISHTSSGNQENNNQVSSFAGLDNFQFLGINPRPICGSYWSTPFKLSYIKAVKEKLQKLLSGKVLKNSWYLVSFDVTTGMKLEKFKIYSSVKNGITNEIEQAFAKTGPVEQYFKSQGKATNLFPIKVLDQKILWGDK